MGQWKEFSFAFGAKTTTSAVLALAAGSTLLVLLLLVRMRQSEEDRRRSLAQLVFAVLATSLSLVRLIMLPLGFGDRFVHRTLGVVDTVCLALAITLTLIRLFFDVIPGRFNKRVPPIIAEVVAMVALVIIVLGALGDSVAKNVSSLVATSAVLTAILGLALQSTLSNLFAGLALQMDRAFSSGDWIQVGGREGRIMEVRWRSTALRTKDGDMVLLPNSRMLTEEVHNFSRPLERRRVWLKVSFHYRHPPNEVKAIITSCLRGIPGVMSDPAPDCFPREFGESAITYAVRLWVEKFDRTAEIEGEALTRIWYAAKRANLEIPFPIRTLLMTTDEGSKREAEAKAERARRLDVLSRMDLFESLQPNDKELLADGMRPATFAAGQPSSNKAPREHRCTSSRRGRCACRWRAAMPAVIWPRLVKATSSVRCRC